MTPSQTASPLVSIVIPTYEQENVVMHAVTSALEQDYPVLEVIVADDASPTARYRSVQALQDSRLRYVRNDANLGRTGNYRNGALHLAKGEWVLNLDGDDHLCDPSFVSAAMARAAADPGAVIVAARCITRHSSGDAVSPTPGDTAISGRELLQHLPDQRLLFMHLATLYRRDAAHRIGMYRSPAISSDWESLYRLALEGNVLFMDRVVGVWCKHGANESSSSDWQRLAQNLEIWGAIFDAATHSETGTTAFEAARARCIAHFGAIQLPSVLRTNPRRHALKYLTAVGRLERSALVSILTSPSSLARLAAGLCGYYERRIF